MAAAACGGSRLPPKFLDVIQKKHYRYLRGQIPADKKPALSEAVDLLRKRFPEELGQAAVYNPALLHCFLKEHTIVCIAPPLTVSFCSKMRRLRRSVKDKAGKVVKTVRATNFNCDRFDSFLRMHGICAHKALHQALLKLFRVRGDEYFKLSKKEVIRLREHFAEKDSVSVPDLKSFYVNVLKRKIPPRPGVHFKLVALYVLKKPQEINFCSVKARKALKKWHIEEKKGKPVMTASLQAKMQELMGHGFSLGAVEREACYLGIPVTTATRTKSFTDIFDGHVGALLEYAVETPGITRKQLFIHACTLDGLGTMSYRTYRRHIARHEALEALFTSSKQAKNITAQQKAYVIAFCKTYALRHGGEVPAMELYRCFRELELETKSSSMIRVMGSSQEFKIKCNGKKDIEATSYKKRIRELFPNPPALHVFHQTIIDEFGLFLRIETARSIAKSSCGLKEVECFTLKAKDKGRLREALRKAVSESSLGFLTAREFESIVRKIVGSVPSGSRGVKSLAAMFPGVSVKFTGRNLFDVKEERLLKDKFSGRGAVPQKEVMDFIQNVLERRDLDIRQVFNCIESRASELGFRLGYLKHS